MADTSCNGRGEAGEGGSEINRGDGSARTNRESSTGGSKTEPSQGERMSRVKRWSEWTTFLIAVKTLLFTIVLAGLCRAYIFVEGFKPIENISFVSFKEHYLPRVEEMNMMEVKFNEVEERWRNAYPQAKGSLACLYLTGKPGSGKTQLALGYARKFYYERLFYRYTFPHIAVVHLDAANLAESYPKLLEQFNPIINTKQMTLDQMKTKVEEELKKFSRWLLVVDNVNSSAIKYPMPKIVDWQVGRILVVTSNHNVSTANFAAKHKLGGMTEQEAIKLLKKTSRHDGKYEEASALVNFLGLVPLSITSAGVYIERKRRNDHGYSFGDYQYGNVSNEADKFAQKDDLIDRIMHHSVRDAVNITLEDDDKDGTFRKVFTLLACCGDSPVPMTLIARLLGISPHKDELYQSLYQVRECLLLDHTTSSDKSEDVRIQKETITVNSITRKVLREELKDSSKQDFLTLLKRIREAFIECGLDEEKKDTNEWYEIRRKLITHMESVQETTNATKDYREDPRMSCDYEYVLGKCYANSIPEELGKAEQHLDNAKNHCQEPSERLNDIIYEFGGIKRRQGLTEESIEYYQLYLKTGTNKKKKLRAAGELSKTYNHRGEFEEVKKIFRDLDGNYSEKELVTLYTQLGIASVWLGEGEEAKMYLQKALDQCSTRQKLRPMTSLVRVYHLMGKYNESLDLLNEMQELYSKSDKLESGGLAIVEGRRSATHHFLMNKDESIKHAKETLKRVQAMQETDPKNVGIAIALISLGPVYSELDEVSLEKAEKALETAKDNIREPYFQYTRLVAQLGRLKQLRDKRLKEAMDILVELKEQTKLLHDHIGCRDLFDYLGQVYFELGMYNESVEAFMSCQTIVDGYYRHYPQHDDVEYVKQQIGKANQARNM